MYIAHINPIDVNKIQSVYTHSRNVSSRCSESLSYVRLSSTGALLGLIHDMGKYSDEFQQHICEQNTDRVNHAFVGAKYLMDTYNNKWIAHLSWVIASHHSIQDDIYEDKDIVNSIHFKLTDIKELTNIQGLTLSQYNQCVERFFMDCISIEDFNAIYNNSMEEMESCIKSIFNYNPSKEQRAFAMGCLRRLLLSALIDADYSDTAEFTYGTHYPKYQADWEQYYSDFLNFLKKYKPDTEINKCRGEMSEYCDAFATEPSGIYELKLPTGGSKTLCSTRFGIKHGKIHQKSRFIYCAPFLGILDQNAKEIKNALNNHPDILEHHSDIINETLSDKTQYKLDTDKWENPIIISSTVQLMNIFCGGEKSYIRRFKSLVNSTIVIDEVQSIPVEQYAIFCATLNFLSDICHTTVILCSATEPAFNKVKCSPMHISPKQFIPEEKLEYYKTVFKRNTIVCASKDKNLTLPQLCDFVNEKIIENQSLLVVCNTKKEAYEVFNNITDNSVVKYLLSASECVYQRKEFIDTVKSLLKQKLKIVVVSTQVIEAGVDISFQCAIRVLAGLDNLIQTAGRCNRNKEYNPNDCTVYSVTLDNEKLGSLQTIRDNKECMEQVIKNNQDLETDTAISEYYTRCISADINPDKVKYQVNIDNATVNLYDLMCGKKENLWGAYQLKTAWENYRLFDTNTYTVIVPYKHSIELIEQLRETQDDLKARCDLLQQLRQFTISIYSNQLNALVELGFIERLFDGEVLILSSLAYDSMVGLLPIEQLENLSLIF